MSEPFGYCLNTSTIRGDGLTLLRKIQIAAQAGYTGIEPWVRELDDHVKAGGSLGGIAKACRDAGLSIESCIGFFEFIVDDDATRAKGLAEARRNMDVLAQADGKRIASPPFGATEVVGLDLLKAAKRYRALLELGDQTGIVPIMEFWAHSKSVHTLGEAVCIAVEAHHPKACILGDVFHLYKGGSDWPGLAMLRGERIGIFHMNDYPASPPRDIITDADRVMPGDGIAPLDRILRTLRDIGYRGHLSLELFSKTYWAQDPLSVARLGLEKMKAAVARVLG
jgi:sugar phosphate isomerase/epimerase